ncbi:hypothetical protein PF010_g11772 [Phytophthora fragariae]|uniref:Uncharacterized protein n=1 Tax=Phytophthora fragariae TaxID=53985 RepID=A0A6G0L5U0_9STRA|nr:hypothetical protein PF010_g11772 [Phytophthora fragariae]
MTATKTVSKTKAGKARLVVRKSPRKMPESSNNNDDEDEMSTSGGKTRPVSQSEQRQNVGQDEPRHSDAQSDQAVVGGHPFGQLRQQPQGDDGEAAQSSKNSGAAKDEGDVDDQPASSGGERATPAAAASDDGGDDGGDAERRYADGGGNAENAVSVDSRMETMATALQQLTAMVENFQAEMSHNRRRVVLDQAQGQQYSTRDSRAEQDEQLVEFRAEAGPRQRRSVQTRVASATVVAQRASQEPNDNAERTPRRPPSGSRPTARSTHSQASERRRNR